VCLTSTTSDNFIGSKRQAKALLRELIRWRTRTRTMERIPLVNVLYGPVAQVVDMLQRDPTDQLHGMNVVYCAFGGEAGAGFLGLLASDQVYRFNGQSCQIVYVPTSPLPMSGLVVVRIGNHTSASLSCHRAWRKIETWGGRINGPWLTNENVSDD